MTCQSHHSPTDAHDPSTNPAAAMAICDPTRALFLINAISEVGVKGTHQKKPHIFCQWSSEFITRSLLQEHKTNHEYFFYLLKDTCSQWGTSSQLIDTFQYIRGYCSPHDVFLPVTTDGMYLLERSSFASSSSTDSFLNLDTNVKLAYNVWLIHNYSSDSQRAMKFSSVTCLICHSLKNEMHFNWLFPARTSRNSLQFFQGGLNGSLYRLSCSCVVGWNRNGYKDPAL